MDTLTTLSIELGAALKTRGFLLALAESCTGGMLAEAVTSVAGSSAWFDRAYITYSNQAKIDMLGVRAETLEKFGAVSEEVAAEMALGCLKMSTLKHSQVKIAGSITGIAGPDGGSADKPVGTVCFAWAALNQTTRNQPASASTQHFTGNRQQIRQQAAAFLMQQLMQAIN